MGGGYTGSTTPPARCKLMVRIIWMLARVFQDGVVNEMYVMETKTVDWR